MNAPVVSVIIPTHNRPQLLQRAIKSVVSQTYQGIELIVIDDASQDKIKLPSNYNSLLDVQIIRNDKSLGPSVARNIGIDVAKGEYISFLDDDDEYFPEKIRSAIETLNNEDDYCRFVYGDTLVIEEDRQYSLVDSVGISRSQNWSDNKFAALVKNNWIHANSFVVEIDLARRKKFDPKALARDDWNFALRCLQESSAIFIDQVVATWDCRSHKDRGASITDIFKQDSQYRMKTYEYHKQIFNTWIIDKGDL